MGPLRLADTATVTSDAHRSQAAEFLSRHGRVALGLSTAIIADAVAEGRTAGFDPQSWLASFPDGSRLKIVGLMVDATPLGPEIPN
jgi:hypothetical protein